MKRLACVVALVLAVAGCGDPASGYVVSKRIEPPQDWIQPVPIYTTLCSGSPAVCTPLLIGFVDVPRHIDECPKLWLKPDPAEKDTDTVCVDRGTYERVSIGGFYQELES